MKLSFEEMFKSEDHKSLAAKGLMLGYPVKVQGKTHRSDGIAHHVTVKFFEGEHADPEKAHIAAMKLPLQSIDATKTHVKPLVFPTRFGTTVHVLGLHGPGVDHVVQSHEALASMGIPDRFKFMPHVTVDKEIHEMASKNPEATAADLGLEFGEPELKLGPEKLHAYSKMKKSVRGALTALGIAAAVAGGPTDIKEKPIQPPTQAQHRNAVKHRFLSSVQEVESRSGKDTEHASIESGPLKGQRAYGKYGLMPITIQETVKSHPDLKRQYGKILNLNHQQVHGYMKAHPHLEDEVAGRHTDRLIHVFNGDVDSMAMAWLNGIAGTVRAKQNGKNLKDHWYVKRIRAASGKPLESQKKSKIK
jgi:hypothetical protein